MARKPRIKRNPLTVHDVIMELGGIGVVAKLTQRGTTAVHNWRARGCMPAALYHVMTSELQERGFTAPPELWGQEAVRQAA